MSLYHIFIKIFNIYFILIEYFVTNSMCESSLKMRHLSINQVLKLALKSWYIISSCSKEVCICFVENLGAKEVLKFVLNQYNVCRDIHMVGPIVIILNINCTKNHSCIFYLCIDYIELWFSTYIKLLVEKKWGLLNFHPGFKNIDDSQMLVVQQQSPETSTRVIIAKMLMNLITTKYHVYCQRHHATRHCQNWHTRKKPMY